MLDGHSLKKLAGCDPRLINVVMAVSERYPIKVLCGHRTQEEQDKAVAEGKSQTPWPTGKHNPLPSMAVDLVPLEKVGGKEFIDWNDRERMTLIAGVMLCEGFHQGVKLRWGGDWNGDTITKDNKFDDLPHFEILEG